MQGNIDNEAEARKAADTALGQRIDGLNTRLTAAEAEIVKINQLLTVLQQQMTSLDATVTGLAKTIADIETSLNNLKQIVLILVNRVDSISETINKIISGEQDLPYVKRAGDTMTGALGLDYSRSGSISNFGAIALGASKPTGSHRPMIGVVGLQNSNGNGILELHGKDQVVVELGPDAETDSTQVATLDVGGADIISRIRVRDASWNAKGSIDATNNGLGIYATGKQIAVGAGELKLNAPITSDIQVADDSKVVKGRLSDTTDGVALSAEDGACLKVGAEAVTVCDNGGGTSQIKGVKTPTEANDAVNKGYVDGLLGLQYFSVPDGIKWAGKTETSAISGVMLNIGKTVMLVLDPKTWYPPAGAYPDGTLRLPMPSGWADRGLDNRGVNGYFCWKQASAGSAGEGSNVFPFSVTANKTSETVNPTLSIALKISDETAHILEASPVIFVASYYAPAT